MPQQQSTSGSGASNSQHPYLSQTQTATVEKWNQGVPTKDPKAANAPVSAESAKAIEEYMKHKEEMMKKDKKK